MKTASQLGYPPSRSFTDKDSMESTIPKVISKSLGNLVMSLWVKGQLGAQDNCSHVEWASVGGMLLNSLGTMEMQGPKNLVITIHACSDFKTAYRRQTPGELSSCGKYDKPAVNTDSCNPEEKSHGRQAPGTGWTLDIDVEASPMPRFTNRLPSKVLGTSCTLPHSQPPTTLCTSHSYGNWLPAGANGQSFIQLNCD
ncbi:Ww Domain-Binding Protein 11 [Manis pentadactyla]|nr:Ww Domain-Binding Protein 11 [Manis pentadactyla]